MSPYDILRYGSNLNKFAYLTRKIARWKEISPRLGTPLKQPETNGPPRQPTAED